MTRVAEYVSVPQSVLAVWRLEQGFSSVTSNTFNTIITIRDTYTQSLTQILRLKVCQGSRFVPHQGPPPPTLTNTVPTYSTWTLTTSAYQLFSPHNFSFHCGRQTFLELSLLENIKSHYPSSGAGGGRPGKTPPHMTCTHHRRTNTWPTDPLPDRDSGITRQSQKADYPETLTLRERHLMKASLDNYKFHEGNWQILCKRLEVHTVQSLLIIPTISPPKYNQYPM